MKRKVMIGVWILLAIILLIPIPMRLKDGGTVIYHAILYRVEDVHRLAPAGSDQEYIKGTIVKILGVEVFNNVASSKILPNDKA